MSKTEKASHCETVKNLLGGALQRHGVKNPKASHCETVKNPLGGASQQNNVENPKGLSRLKRSKTH